MGSWVRNWPWTGFWNARPVLGCGIHSSSHRPEVAEPIQRRIDELAQHVNDGALSDGDRSEYEALINELQAEHL